MQRNLPSTDGVDKDAKEDQEMNTLQLEMKEWTKEIKGR